jgi:hypothetical protein
LSLTSRDDVVTGVWRALKGAVIDLPAPMGKTAAEIAPLKIERRPLAGRPKEDLVTADYRGAPRHRASRSWRSEPSPRSIASYFAWRR